ncbi:MAG TPA: HAMP domain-containing protein, partial [Nitrospirota bacterium]|nr:HAMP domain-containing protein [Nitrospirota bacterium]
MKELFSKINSNLKAKIVIFAAGCLIFFLAFSTFNNIRVERKFYIKTIENHLRLLANTIESSLVDAMGRDQRDEVQRVIEKIGSNEDIADLRIFSDSKVILRSSDPAEIGTHVDDENYMKYKQTADTFIFNKAGQKKLFLVKPILNRPACYGCHDSKQQINGILEVSFSLIKAEAEINQHLERMIIFAIAISILIALAVFLVIEFLINRPITKLKEAMDKAERGEVIDLRDIRTDELGQLQRKFTDMLGSVKDLNAENNRKEQELIRNFEVANSHARLKSMIEAMPDGVSILTPDMIIQEMNPRNMEIFPGVQRGTNCYRSIHGRSDPCPHCGVLKVFQDGNVHEH